MENKCNKTPNNSNNNNATNTKYMDHVYCHTNQTKNSYNIMTTPGSMGGGGGGAAASPNADVLALLKENKQLKAMLILHLDLIQEQSDQLMAKEKFLIARTEELETLRVRNAALENQVKDLQKQLQQQIKRSGEVSTLPPPPLAKIQCKTNQTATVPMTTLAPVTNCAKIISTTGTAKSNIIGECNGKLISKIVLQRVNMCAGRGKHNQSPQSQTTDTENDEDAEDEEAEDEEHDEAEEEEVEEGEAEEEDGVEEEDEVEDESHQEDNHQQEEEDDGEQMDEEEEAEHHSKDNKSNTQPVVIDDVYDDTGNTTEDSNEVLAVQSKRLRLRQAAKQSLAIPRGAKPSVSPASTTTNDGQTAFKAVTTSTSVSGNTTHISKQPPTPSRGKQMTIMRWHAPDYNTDESVSCDSTAEHERRSTSTTSSPQKPSPNVVDKKRSHDNTSQHPHQCSKIRRCTYISTPQLYSTREWEDEAFNCDYDYEFYKAEAKLLQSDNPKLEIPKWTEHELTPSYCIEGTEDLSDEIFLKRHAKLEVDEKRRKKWDVQQIREQRRIERLKRRHCKDEIQPSQETPTLQTFYPTTENLQTICFVHDLPVQAFGEMIPKLTGPAYLATAKGEQRRGFQLPWLDKEQLQYLQDNNKSPTVATINTNETSAAATVQMQQQMLNSSFTFLKKRRRQQSSSFGHNPRQRNQAAKLLANNTTNNPPAITTTTASGTTTSSSTTSTQSFLNIVKTNFTTSSLNTTTSTTTTTSSLVTPNPISISMPANSTIKTTTTLTVTANNSNITNVSP